MQRGRDNGRFKNYRRCRTPCIDVTVSSRRWDRRGKTIFLAGNVGRFVRTVLRAGGCRGRFARIHDAGISKYFSLSFMLLPLSFFFPLYFVGSPRSVIVFERRRLLHTARTHARMRYDIEAIIITVSCMNVCVCVCVNETTRRAI